MKLKPKFMLQDIKAAANARNQLLLAALPDQSIGFLAKPKTDLGEL